MPDDALQEDIRAIARIGNISQILKTVSDWTGLRFTAVARVTDERWIAAAVHDGLGFGLAPGGELDVTTTLCSEVRDCRGPILIDHASADPVFRDHRTPKMYKFESYLAVPIFRQNGELFGTVCGLDPIPRALRDGKTLPMVELLAQLISLQLEAEERHAVARVALAAERRASTVREEFIAVLGHDLRNPLSSIVAGTELLLRRAEDEAMRSTLGRMRSSTKRIVGLVDDMLDLARGRLGGGIEVHAVVVDDLERRLEHVVAEIRASNPTRRIDATFEHGSPVHCDAKRIEQVASNLLANAITHGTPATPIRFAVGGNDERWELTVSNAAAPIRPEVMGRLFEPFARGENVGRSGGLGLGLYIVGQIAKSHDGTVTPESTDAGTTFRFAIPRRPLRQERVDGP